MSYEQGMIAAFNMQALVSLALSLEHSLCLYSIRKT